MGVILDTSLLIAFERGRLEIETFIRGREHEHFGITTVTAAELLYGVERADTPTRRMKRSSYVERVLEVYPIYPFDLAAARVYSTLWSEADRTGLRVSAHDLIIAATAVSLGFSVATLNQKDYRKIPGLALDPLQVE